MSYADDGYVVPEDYDEILAKFPQYAEYGYVNSGSQEWPGVEFEPQAEVEIQGDAAGGDAATIPPIDSPEQFLNVIWGGDLPDGWVTVFAKAAQDPPQTYARHSTKLAEAVSWARERNRSGDVWFGIGLRKHDPGPGKRGNADDVSAIPGLWFDLDVQGPGHKKTELPRSLEEAEQFLETLPLKPTIVVHSGGGFQAYWMFRSPLIFRDGNATRDRAKELSARWNRFVIAEGEKHGWNFDNTSDLARILRVPGTWNRKTNSPVLVTVPEKHVNLSARYELTDFDAAMPKDATSTTVRAVAVPSTSPRQGRDECIAASLELIVPRCAWLRHTRDDAAKLPEPEWFAMISIVARCKDGDRHVHAWSSEYAGYNRAQTDAKIKHALNDGGPRTCDSVKADFGTYCNDCAARVKSPIVLGREDHLPEGFQARGNGIYFRTVGKDNNPEWQWLCSPLKVLALTRESDNREWGRLVEVIDPDGNAHRWAMPMRALRGSGEDLRGELLSMGLTLASGKGPARLNQFLSQCRPQARVNCVPRIGWHGRRFILPDAVFGTEEGESVILQAERIDNPFKTLGTLAEWQEQVGRYCVGNSRLVVSVSAALAAPLLDLAGAESGGLHLVGGSSLGKTTALVVAGSVCGGGGVRGYIMQWRATANGLESVAVAHCDSLLCLDELSQVTAQAAGEAAYMLTNQTGKARANKQGTARKPAEWRILFLSTGEITLADKIREEGKAQAMAGQLVRVVDIYADAGTGLGIFEELHGFPDGDTFSRHLKDAAKRAYGVALRAFLEKLTSDIDDAMQVIPAFIKDFMAAHCPAEADGQVKRVCARFALVAVGGECGAAYRVLPWPKGEATQAAARCFQDWLSLRGGTGASEIQAGLTQVRAFFLAHGSSRFEVWGNQTDEAKTINRAGFRRKDDLTGAWRYFVPPATFKAEIARGYDAKRLVKELVERGLVIPGTDGKPASQQKIPGQPNAKYYHFAPKVVVDDQCDETRQGLTKNRVARVAKVTGLESQGVPGNSTENPRVTRVTAPGASAEPERTTLF